MSDGSVGNRPLSYQEPSVDNRETMMIPPRDTQDEASPLPPLFSASQPELVPDLVQIALYIPDRPTPIMVAEAEFILGRITANERDNIVDLSPYRGYLMGVSRHHVMIAQATGGYLVKDLGSANGTWLNGARLSPFVPYALKDGDHLELGRLSLTVRFVCSGTAPY